MKTFLRKCSLYFIWKAYIGPVRDADAYTCTKSFCIAMPFEGKEKRLEILFHSTRQEVSLRDTSMAVWIEVIRQVQATILQCTHAESFDAFILSESSMFIYDTSALLITCGQTTILSALKFVQSVGEEIGMQVARIQYSHSNLTFPMLQPSPYSSIELETQYLKHLFRDLQFTEAAGTTNMSWYCWTLSKRPCFVRPTCTLFLEDICPAVAKHFMQDAIERSGDDMLQQSKLTSILAMFGKILDAYAFHPCGLSANGQTTNEDGHWTLHVTPEQQNSFVSLEFCADDARARTAAVDFLEFWKPQRAQIVTCGMISPKFDIPAYVCQSKTSLIAPGSVDVNVFAFEMTAVEDKSINKVVCECDPYVDDAAHCLAIPGGRMQ